MKKPVSVDDLSPLFRSILKSVPPDSVWIVGGFLRDSIIGRPLKDVDFAVKDNALKAAQALGAHLKSRPFALDEDRGTYRIMQSREGFQRIFDFSKLQGKTLRDDILKRDFTINALALPLEKHSGKGFRRDDLVDLVEAQKDMHAKKIRLVSESALKDDPLRLLRAFRFSAELGYEIDKKTRTLIAKHRRLLTQSAAERVREELLKILVTPDAAIIFRQMDAARLLTVFLPEGELLRKTAHEYYGREGVLEHSLNALAHFDKLMRELPQHFTAFLKPLDTFLNEPVAGFPRYALLKMAVFLHDIGKPQTAKVEKGKLHFYGHDRVGADIAGTVAKRLRFSGDETRTIQRVIGAHMRPGNLGHASVLTDKAIYRFYRDLGDDAVALLIVALADHYTYLTENRQKPQKDPVYRAIIKMLSSNFLRKETVAPPKLIDGNLLMKKLGLAEGREIGRILDAVREAQAVGKVKTAAEALAYAKKITSEPAEIAGDKLTRP